MRQGNVICRSPGEMLHLSAPNDVVQFDFLYAGRNGSQASQGLVGARCFRSIQVIMDGLSNYLRLELVNDSTAESMVAPLLTWSWTLGVP